MIDWLTLTTFVDATALVAVLTSFFVRRMGHSDNPTEDFFTGGRMLTWPMLAGSLLLTNISSEQRVGRNGLPKYLASGFTTTPAFLEKRFDKATRQLVSGLFRFGYVTVLLPSILYTGSLAFKTMFQLDRLLETGSLKIRGP